MQNQLARSSRYAAQSTSAILPWARWQHRWAFAFLSLCTLLVVLVIHGFETGNVNNFRDQSIQLPIIYSYANSSLFVGDFLLEARHSYVTWFYPALGVASRYVSIDGLMLTLYVLSIMLTISAVYVLAEALYPKRNVGLFAAILWIAYFPNPGGDFTHSPFVTHSTFAIALDLWALVMILRRQHTLAALIIGLTANINAMTSFFVGVAWLFSLLYDRKRLLQRLIWGGLVIGVAGLPILWWRFSQPLAEASSDQFLHIIRTRLWYAVFPFAIEGKLWIGFGGMVALWVYSLRFGKPQDHHMILLMTAGIIGLCIIGTVFTEIIPVEFMVEMQSIRSTWILNLFIMIYLAHMLRALLYSSRPAYIALAFLILSGFIVARWGVEWFPPSQPTPYSLVADLDTPWSLANTKLIMVLLGLLLAALLLVYWRLAQHTTPRFSVVHSRRVAAWIGFAVIGFAIPGFLPSHIPAEQRTVTENWEETLIWVEQNTPVDTTFVTPPTLDGFRVLAKRAQIGDWKDGTVGIFYNGWAIEWYERMLMLGFDPDSFSFEQMTQERLCVAAARYRVDYVVVFVEDRIQGTPVFENERFQVIRAADLVCAR